MGKHTNSDSSEFCFSMSHLRADGSWLPLEDMFIWFMYCTLTQGMFLALYCTVWFLPLFICHLVIPYLIFTTNDKDHHRYMHCISDRLYFNKVMAFSFHLSHSLFSASQTIIMHHTGRTYYRLGCFLKSKPCCMTAPQSGSWATCSRISSTSRFFPGGSTSFVILCCRVRGSAISWINWPSGLLSTYRHTNKIN